MDYSRKLVNLEIQANVKALQLMDDIKEVIIKFDGKIPDKRLDTALKKIDSDLSFKQDYNFFIIDLWIRNRSVSVKKENETYSGTYYIKSDRVGICYCACKSCYGDGCLNEDGTINAEMVIKSINGSKKYLLEYNNSMVNTVNNINDKIKEYEELKKRIVEFNNSVNHTVAQYYELDKIKNVY